MELSLSQLCHQITDSLQADFAEPVWVHAEISELSVRNGHCYMELVEKNADNNAFLAKTRANCWANIFALLKPYFEAETGQTLRAGLQVLLSVTVEFHPVYGMSLSIRDINPTYTIGNLAQQRMAIIAQLTADGIIDMNKQLQLPLLLQRIAVISSDSAAGYGDFCHQLNGNAEKFAIYRKLFPALMQGERAEASIIEALDKINNEIELFDAVVIIRGGGASTDLSCFDSYNLCLNCAQFPLPIIAGIGHQRDVSVLDMVAHTSVKTPTAAAEFILNSFSVQQQRIVNAKQCLQRTATQLSATLQMNLDNYRSRLKSNFTYRLAEQQNLLKMQAKTIELHSPERILKQGYTLTLVNGEPVSSATKLKQGQSITTQFIDGTVSSIISEK